MNAIMYASASAYYSEGLNVIPVVWQEKRPALPEWKKYQTTPSTAEEVNHWFGNGTLYNIGIIHGQLRDGLGYYGTFDIDHDKGIFNRLKVEFPFLFGGRIEQSGSGEGFHVPLITSEIVAWGNKTWKTQWGSVNYRASNCQTVVPPSIHPTGNPYTFLQSGDIARVRNLDDVFEWLNELSDKPQMLKRPPRKTITPANRGSLLEQVLAYWNPERVFDYFGLVNQIQEERNGDIRLFGNGGLLIRNKNGAWVWYCHEEQTGGGAIEAWVWCQSRIGQTLDKQVEFRRILIQMAEAGGIDLAGFYKPGDEGHLKTRQTKRRRTTQKDFGKLRKNRRRANDKTTNKTKS